MRPGLLRLGMCLWPPFLGAGIRVRRIAPDYGEVLVEMKLGLTNRNYFGTHFGGSLYAMTDPFFALMLTHRLGPRYLVWDQSGSIDYLTPGRGTARAHFVLEAGRVEEIRGQAAGGGKVLPEFTLEVKDRAGHVVARVRKTIYVRLKKRHRPASVAGTESQ
jgi:acyl-coenzyme A thioesterase PaaI-like protein